MSSPNKEGEKSFSECNLLGDEEIGYYALRLAAILSMRSSKGSDYAYTKELREALEKMIKDIDLFKKSKSWIQIIARAEVPTDLAPCDKAAECLMILFEKLLRKFYEDMQDKPPGTRQEYANILLSAIAKAAKDPSNLPEEARKFRESFIQLCSGSELTQSGVGGGSLERE